MITVVIMLFRKKKNYVKIFQGAINLVLQKIKNILYFHELFANLVFLIEGRKKYILKQVNAFTRAQLHTYKTFISPATKELKENKYINNK